MSSSDFTLSFDFKDDLKSYILNRLMAERESSCPIEDIIYYNNSTSMITPKIAKILCAFREWNPNNSRKPS